MRKKYKNLKIAAGLTEIEMAKMRHLCNKKNDEVQRYSLVTAGRSRLLARANGHRAIRCIIAPGTVRS